jgi:hypothetical protein
MGLFSFCLNRLRRRRAPAAGVPESGVGSGPCDSAHPAEPPLSFSELVAASAFLDFGNLLDERWLSRRCAGQNGPDERRK